VQPLPKKPLNLSTPILDVRSPGEYAQGALPRSANVPILSDEERARIGTTYKHSGHDAAVTLGHELVTGEVKQLRVQQWVAFIKEHPDARVMCWRGGQRSQIAQSWLAEQGHEVARIPGGYKSLRRTCIETLDHAGRDNKPWWVLAGRTGVRKTVLLRRLPNSIDLEGFAHHRGSAFGALEHPQPAPATFENALAYAYSRHDHDTLVLEDESRTIGRLALPGTWHARMQLAPLVLLEADLHTRVSNIVEEYVDQAIAAGQRPEHLQQHYRDALRRIAKRLGGALHQQIDQLIARAFRENCGHEEWVRALLHDYYDPMYDYQLRTKTSRIRYRGDMADVQAYLEQLAQR